MTRVECTHLSFVMNYLSQLSMAGATTAASYEEVQSGPCANQFKRDSHWSHQG